MKPLIPVIVLILGMATPAFAQTPTTTSSTNTNQNSTNQNSSTTTNADSQQYKQMLQEASSMMGYIGIANIALLHNMTGEATSNVQQALTIARQLEGQTTQLNADLMKTGKLVYQSGAGKSYNYWLPIENDTFVVSDLDSEYMKSKQPKAVEEDAQTVNTQIALNTKQVRDALERAATAINTKNYGDAEVALQEAQQSTFTDQTIHKMPLTTARDNLELAKALTKSKDYDGASFALTHAKDALTQYRKTVQNANTTQVEKLQNDITGLQKEIAKNKPSIAANIENRIDNWIHDVENFNPKSGNSPASTQTQESK